MAYYMICRGEILPPLKTTELSLPYLIPALFYLANTVQQHARKCHRNDHGEWDHSIARSERCAGLGRDPAAVAARPAAAALSTLVRRAGLLASTLRHPHSAKIPPADQDNQDKEEIKQGKEAIGQGAKYDQEAVQGRGNSKRAQHRLRVADLQPDPGGYGRERGEYYAHAVD